MTGARAPPESSRAILACVYWSSDLAHSCRHQRLERGRNVRVQFSSELLLLRGPLMSTGGKAYGTASTRHPALVESPCPNGPSRLCQSRSIQFLQQDTTERVS